MELIQKLSKESFLGELENKKHTHTHTHTHTQATHIHTQNPKNQVKKLQNYTSQSNVRWFVIFPGDLVPMSLCT